MSLKLGLVFMLPAQVFQLQREEDQLKQLESDDPLVRFVGAAWGLVLPAAVTYTGWLTMVRDKQRHDKQRHDEVLDTGVCSFRFATFRLAGSMLEAGLLIVALSASVFLVGLGIALMQISK